MLVGMGLFVDLDWGRLPLAVAATAAGALAFAAMGLAVGALTREVRAASLLCVMASLPLTFLALVPSGLGGPGAVRRGAGGLRRVPVQALAGARWTSRSTAGEDLGIQLLHLLALFAGFGVLTRFALNRFALR